MDAYVDFFSGGADNNCTSYDNHEVAVPTVVVPGGQLPNEFVPEERPDRGTTSLASWGDGICVLGFAPSVPVRVSTTAPGGTVRVRHLCRTRDGQACGDGDVWWPWTALPGDPLGDYLVHASQGQRKATGSFRLVRPTEPVYAIRDNVQHSRNMTPVPPGLCLPRGVVVEIGFAGFRPRQHVRLFFYYKRHIELGDSIGRFIAATTVSMNNAGEALFSIPTSRRDPPGYFGVRSKPAVDLRFGRDASEVFCLR